MLKPLLLAVAIAGASLPAFAAPTPGVQDGVSPLKDLQKMHYVTGMSLSGDDDLANKRSRSMRDAALSVGAQHGYVATMNELRKQLDAESDTWEALFPFKDVMRIASKGDKSLFYLPPVIIKTEGLTSTDENHKVIKISNTYYEIYKEERVVLNAPDWREYLLIDIPVDLSKPVGALLPKTPAEQQLWSDSVAEGWQAGVNMANEEMTARVRNLGTDFTGMVRYLQLVEGTGQMTPTFLAEQTINRVKSKNGMHIGQTTIAITAPATFNDNVGGWVPLDLDPRDGYRSAEERAAINRGE
ncbi:defect-in-organelle-trafficking protein DotC [Pseudomonas nitritireducens]|uniref:Defect-in-organelle-trafficking protein DotC n=1 Tax=Pseudomonas nitroreducens TaxID=46680 RepID=A0A7W7NZB3_PSENT|nr:type IV secretory system conjugative DNA transfer family protein [Pseudomonas nitritireducens]MBB4861409.1 defect-in-organelle-trafficking protein DotC [Pseudomonas nitritireducens]